MTKEIKGLVKLASIITILASFSTFIGAAKAKFPDSLSAFSQEQEIARQILVAAYHDQRGSNLYAAVYGEVAPYLKAAERASSFYGYIKGFAGRLDALAQDDDEAFSRYLEEGVNQIMEHFPGATKEAGAVLFALGYEYLNQFKNERAARAFAISAAAHLQQEELTDASWSYLYQAHSKQIQNDIPAVRRLFEQFQAVTNTARLGASYYSKSSDTWRLLKAYQFQLSAKNYNLEGNFPQAIKNGEIALRLERNGRKDEDFEEDDTVFLSGHYFDLGKFCYNLGDYKRAQAYYTQAIEMNEGYLNRAVNHYVLGISALSNHDYPLARSYFNTALDRLGNSPREVDLKTRVLTSLSTVHQASKQYKVALRFSLQATEQATMKTKYLAWSSVGACYLKQNQYALAISALKKAEKAFQPATNEQDQSLGFLSEIYRLSGDAHQGNGDPVAALNYYQKALISNHWNFTDSLEVLNNPPFAGVKDPLFFIRALSGKAKALAQMSVQPAYGAASIKTFNLSMQWIDSLRTGYSSEATMLDWSSTYKAIYEDAVVAAYGMYQQSGDEHFLESAFLFAEESKNAILLEQIQGLKGKSSAGIPQEELDREKDLLIDQAYYHKALRNFDPAKDAEQIRRYQSFLAQTQLELATLRTELERDYPRYRKIKYQKETPNLTKVRATLLDKKSALISYFIGKDQAFAIVITAEKSGMVALKAPEILNGLTQDFITELLAYEKALADLFEGVTTYNRKGNALYEAVVAPVKKELPEGIERLLIIPDAGLNGLPFSALPTSRAETSYADFGEQPYLLHDFQIQYAYSAALQIRSRERAATLTNSESCLAFAPPYEKEPDTSLVEARTSSPTELKWTAKEIREIAQYITGTFDSTLTATKANFISQAGRYGILHLAMHGVADPQDPNGNHLIFTNLVNPGDSLGDNRLFHYEIANLDLVAQMVVLSACQTGVGKYEEGEGVYSLARSFSYAGVPSVVMSLWEVSDSGTSKIMPNFYEMLANGNTKDRSLQQAKIQFVSDANPDKRHPFFWAAFVGLGEPSPITATPLSGVTWGIGIAFVLLLFGGWGYRMYTVGKK